MLVKGVASWQSSVQEVMPSGNSKAECVALSVAVREVLFLRKVHEFLESSMMVGAVNVYEDYEGAIELATNKHSSRRRKHH